VTGDPGALAKPLRIPGRPKPGVNLVGFLEAESGLGEVARRLAAVFETTDIPLAPISYRGTLGRQRHPLELSLADDAPYDTNVICLSADDLTTFAGEVGSDFFAKRYSIGVWFWETNVFSSPERSATMFLDELWVASEYISQAVVGEVDVPVHVVPVPAEPLAGPFRTRAELELPERFTFLFVFDFWSGERKNPTAVVDAFTRAFAPGEGPILVLKSINGRDWKPHQLDRLLALAGGREDILLRDGYVSAEERDSYVAACDCYVSLHRSEGLGLTMAEAMACGKPVVATGYSGNLEFMSEENSYLVPYRLVNVPDTWWAHAPGARWAEPDVDAAARCLRTVWERQDEARAIGLRAQREIVERFKPERTREFVRDRLADARERGAVRARGSEHDARPPILEASRELAGEVGEGLARGGGSPPASLVRRLLQRALWPYLEEQRRFETSVLDALVTLHRSVEDLERRLAAVERPPDRERGEG